MAEGVQRGGLAVADEHRERSLVGEQVAASGPIQARARFRQRPGGGRRRATSSQRPGPGANDSTSRGLQGQAMVGIGPGRGEHALDRVQPVHSVGA